MAQPGLLFHASGQVESTHLRDLTAICLWELMLGKRRHLELFTHGLGDKYRGQEPSPAVSNSKIKMNVMKTRLVKSVRGRRTKQFNLMCLQGLGELLQSSCPFFEEDFGVNFRAKPLSMVVKS